MKYLTYKKSGCGFTCCYSLLFFIFLCATLTAQETTTSTDMRVSYLANHLIETTKRLDLPDTTSVYLSLNFTETDDFHKMGIQEILLKNDIKLVETSEFADIIIQIRMTERYSTQKARTFPVRNELYRETGFTTQVVSSADSSVIDIQSISLIEKQNTDAQRTDKWYTPYFITFVLTTLAYLIYFGV